MTKWEYIRLISQRGTAYGGNGGVLDLLEWCDKPSTAAVTLEEAKAFWESLSKDDSQAEPKETE